MRVRVKTELIGCHLSKMQYDLLKAELLRRNLSVAEYLRQTAVEPLMAELAHREQVGADAD